MEVCEKFGAENDVLYNPIKSALMVIRAPSDRQLRIPDFSMNGQVLCAKREVKYLGHFITDDLIRKLYVAFNDVMRMLLNLPRYSSASLMFLNCRARDCRATIRNLIYRFIGRLGESENPLLHGLVDSANSDIMYTSGMWRHWYQELDVYFPVT